LGCTMKEAAKSLHLSAKTIEHYFENVRSKMGEKRKSEIIKIITDEKILF
jgi:DNA-binding NarL/FixJ family response regulator